MYEHARGIIWQLADVGPFGAIPYCPQVRQVVRALYTQAKVDEAAARAVTTQVVAARHAPLVRACVEELLVRTMHD
jgi:hypothetical protein